MCGIAGEILFGERSLSLTDLERAGDRQYRRGPDGGGIYQLKNMALSHRRLKIFDLSDRASQPMVDHTLGLAIVFNGAIYNFHGLREILKAKGYQFSSESDTEVLLKAYHAWGEKCLFRLRGMFSFAIWERDTGNIVLARDRMGIKPLYYAHTQQGFCFASTLPALLEFEQVDRTVDPAGLHYYLNFHAIPEPLTILSGIKKLPPGHVMKVTPDGKIEQHPYWQFTIHDDFVRHVGEGEWLQNLKESLHVAVSRQMLADVPLGVLLSGGLDSSLLVALAAERGHQRIETFSIGFESVGQESGDEFHYSDLVANHFGTQHHRLFISNKQLSQSLGECVRAMSEPMTSHDNIGFYLLSKEVAKHVKVVLSGQGADEIFAGYHWFQQLTGQQAPPHKAARTLYRMLADFPYDEYAHLITPEYRTENHALAFLDRLCSSNPSTHLPNHLLQYESTFALTNGPLGRMDNMSMAASLEARVPFLDEAVVDTALTMPLSMKMQDGGKYLLKQLGRAMLPREVVDRPKGYFPVPALKAMEGGMLELMREVLSPKHVRDRGLFSPMMVEALFADPSQQTPLGASKLWQVGLLEYWLQQQGV